MTSEERRAQLIGIAQRLFFEQGYENTTIADIYETAGVSKGAFYHNFASKEAILQDVLEHMLAGYADGLHEIAGDGSRSARDRLVDVLSSEGRMFRSENIAARVEITESLNSDENVGMAARFYRDLRMLHTKVLADLIRQGQRDGSLDVADADATAEIVAHLWRAFDQARFAAIRSRHTDGAQAAAEHLRKVAKQQFLTIDHVLSLPSGTTSYGWPEFVEAIMAVPPKPAMTLKTAS